MKFEVTTSAPSPRVSLRPFLNGFLRAISASTCALMLMSVGAPHNAEAESTRGTGATAQRVELIAVKNNLNEGTFTLFLSGSAKQRAGDRARVTIPLSSLATQDFTFNAEKLEVIEGYAQFKAGKRRPQADLIEFLARTTFTATAGADQAQQTFVRFALYPKDDLSGYFVKGDLLNSTQNQLITEALNRRSSVQSGGTPSPIFFERGKSAGVTAYGTGSARESGCGCYTKPPPPPPTCGCAAGGCNPRIIRCGPSTPPSQTPPAAPGQGQCYDPANWVACRVYPGTNNQWCCERQTTSCVQGRGCVPASQASGNCNAFGYSWNCALPRSCGQTPFTCDDPVSQDPPSQEPPAQQPPSQEPPVQEPPTQQPPTQEPPTQQPPTQEPPTQQPPTQEPPTQQPPTQEPPTQQPPTQEPPTQQPPTQEPPPQQ